MSHHIEKLDRPSVSNLVFQCGGTFSPSEEHSTTVWHTRSDTAVTNAKMSHSKRQEHFGRERP